VERGGSMYVFSLHERGGGHKEFTKNSPAQKGEVSPKVAFEKKSGGGVKKHNVQHSQKGKEFRTGERYWGEKKKV